MKKFVAGALVALAAMAGAAGANAAVTKYNTLVINRTDGVIEYLQLNTAFSIFANTDHINLIHPKVTVTYSHGEVDNFTFAEHEFADDEIYDGTHAKQSAIEEVENESRTISFDDDAISATQPIVVHDLKGREVARGNKIATSSLPSGIYLVTVGTTTLKIKL